MDGHLSGMGNNTGAIQDYQGVLHGYVRKRLNTPHEADDIVQESLLRFYKRQGGEEIAARHAYLLRIAANLLADRGRALRKRMVPLDTVHETELSAPADQEQARHRSDLQRAFADALQELSPRCRAVFESRRQAGISTPEVARRLAISPRMVQKYMAQAQAHLTARLRPSAPEVQCARTSREGFAYLGGNRPDRDVREDCLPIRGET